MRRQKALLQLVIRISFCLLNQLLYICVVSVVRQSLDYIWVVTGTK